jgi:hypothetical protein
MLPVSAPAIEAVRLGHSNDGGQRLAELTMGHRLVVDDVVGTRRKVERRDHGRCRIVVIAGREVRIGPAEKRQPPARDVVEDVFSESIVRAVEVRKAQHDPTPAVTREALGGGFCLERGFVVGDWPIAAPSAIQRSPAST